MYLVHAEVSKDLGVQFFAVYFWREVLGRKRERCVCEDSRRKRKKDIVQLSCLPLSYKWRVGMPFAFRSKERDSLVCYGYEKGKRTRQKSLGNGKGKGKKTNQKKRKEEKNLLDCDTILRVEKLLHGRMLTQLSPTAGYDFSTRDPSKYVLDASSFEC